jgi:hypothetical protein
MQFRLIVSVNNATMLVIKYLLYLEEPVTKGLLCPLVDGLFLHSKKGLLINTDPLNF